MSDQGIAFLSALQNRMGWLSDRQKVVAENVANASTPGFKPSDLTAQDFTAMVQGQAPDGMIDLHAVPPPIDAEAEDAEREGEEHVQAVEHHQEIDAARGEQQAGDGGDAHQQHAVLRHQPV